MPAVLCMMIKAPLGLSLLRNRSILISKENKKIRTLLLSRKGSDLHGLTQKRKDIRMHAPR